MDVYYNIPAVRGAVRNLILSKKTIGFVPTMGALHEGHISLVDEATKANDITITSIFINPLQFNSKEDLVSYPITLEKDLRFLRDRGCDIVFVPEASKMYPNEHLTQISFGKLETGLEGAHRPGHFNGVALVVIKLLNIIQPTRAYFGQKDFQQFKLIEQLIIDTSLNVTPLMMPIVRQNSGLALSSRNQRLSNSGKEIAVSIFKALTLAAKELKSGATINSSISTAKNYLMSYPDIKIEYLTFVNYKDLSIVETSIDANPLVLCFAGYVDEVRLIDNIIIELDENEK